MNTALILFRRGTTPGHVELGNKSSDVLGAMIANKLGELRGDHCRIESVRVRSEEEEWLYTYNSEGLLESVDKI